MGDTLHDLTGKRFGHWTVLIRAPNRKRAVMWLCRCDCGNVVEVHGTSLKSGTSTQCQKCRAANMPPRSHGLTHHPLYRVWQRMKQCTTSPTHQDYSHYGARGIKVCEEWFNDFKCFYDWAMSHGYQPHLTIERKDVDGDYCPENCTWIPQSEQPRNTTRSLKYRCRHL